MEKHSGHYLIPMFPVIPKHKALIPGGGLSAMVPLLPLAPCSMVNYLLKALKQSCISSAAIIIRNQMYMRGRVTVQTRNVFLQMGKAIFFMMKISCTRLQTEPFFITRRKMFLYRTAPLLLA